MSDFMNWPIPSDWVCETCEFEGWLIWNMIHAQCHCPQCGTVYTMRDGDTILDEPKNIMKSPAAAKMVWDKTGENIIDAPDEVWADAYAEAKEMVTE